MYKYCYPNLGAISAKALFVAESILFQFFNTYLMTAPLRFSGPVVSSWKAQLHSVNSCFPNNPCKRKMVNQPWNPVHLTTMNESPECGLETGGNRVEAKESIITRGKERFILLYPEIAFNAGHEINFYFMEKNEITD